MTSASLLRTAGGLTVALALVVGLSSAPAIAATPVTASAPSTAAYKWFDKKAKSTSDPASYWVVVNKERPLSPKTYAPTDLVSVPVASVNPPKASTSPSR